jgi:hypothetical protein
LIRTVVAKAKRSQKHKDIQRIGVKYGGGIEPQTADKYGQQLAERQSAVQIMAIPVKRQPTHRIKKIYRQYPPDKVKIEVVFDMFYFYNKNANVDKIF